MTTFLLRVNILVNTAVFALHHYFTTLKLHKKARKIENEWHKLRDVIVHPWMYKVKWSDPEFDEAWKKYTSKVYLSTLPEEVKE